MDKKTLEKEIQRVRESFEACSESLGAHQKEVDFHQGEIKKIVEEQMRLQGEFRILEVLSKSLEENEKGGEVEA